MAYFDLLATQLYDVFRIGLLVGLIYTTERNRAQTGVILPIIVGLVFVAIIIATTMPVAGVPIWQAIVTGIIANAVITAVLWLAWIAIKRFS